MRLLEIASHTAVILGIAFAGIEYWLHQQERREEFALEQLQVFQSQHLQEARIELQTYWLDKPLAQLSGKPGSAGVIGALANEQIFPANTSANATNLLMIVESLDIIGACVTSSLCDREIIVRQLGGYAESLFCLYKAPLARLQDLHALSSLGQAAKKALMMRSGCE